MAKIVSRKNRETVIVRTQSKASPSSAQKWWLGKSKDERATMLLDTAGYLKEQLQYRYRQSSIFSRLYSNMPLIGAIGSQLGKINAQNQLPLDRPTMNVVQSCIDTLVSRISQSRPKPTFLTDNGDYKERRLAKQMNNFTQGEFYNTKAYPLARLILRDAAVLGTGCIKIYEGQDNRVALDRVLLTELLIDPNDSLYGTPRQLYQVALIDRDVLADMFPESRSRIERAEQAYPETSADANKTVSDQVMVVEGWRLPSGPDAGDGRHTIAVASINGTLLDEEYTKDKFPFVFLHYTPRMLGFFAQGLAEQLMGTQVEINKLLMTISRSINLMGVPRVWLEDGSKVVKAHFNNMIGMIGTYRGTLPVTQEGTSGLGADIYTQLQRLVDYAYQQSGISALAAASQKPAGLNSGAAIREYDDLQSDRFADLNKRYDEMFVELAYQVIDKAKDIAERDGSYSTVYPNKNGTKEIDLPSADLLGDSFVIQCFDSSSLPRDPAGRLQKITEMMQAGMISIQEGRRLLDYPDLEQNEKLVNASEERILQILDEIVEEGKYTPPDPFMKPELAIELSNQYYNLYVSAKLEEERAEMLRTFNTQAIALQQSAMAAMAPPPMPGADPAQASPEPLPTSPMLPRAA